MTSTSMAELAANREMVWTSAFCKACKTTTRIDDPTNGAGFMLWTACSSCNASIPRSALGNAFLPRAGRRRPANVARAVIERMSRAEPLLQAGDGIRIQPRGDHHGDSDVANGETLILACDLTFHRGDRLGAYNAGWPTEWFWQDEMELVEPAMPQTRLEMLRSVSATVGHLAAGIATQQLAAVGVAPVVPRGAALTKVACRCGSAGGAPPYVNAAGEVVTGFSSLPHEHSPVNVGADERALLNLPPGHRIANPVFGRTATRAVIGRNAEISIQGADGQFRRLDVSENEAGPQRASSTPLYGPHVCPSCWGRHWRWSDDLPPVTCQNGMPCGRANGTCSGCNRTDAEIVDEAWNTDAALIAHRVKNMDGEMRARWLAHLGEKLVDIAPMASDALKAGV